MKKIVVIGDIHGRDLWKKLVDISKMLTEPNYIPTYDKYIFLGDYVDAYTREYESNTISNLIEIIELKKKYLDHIILLWGNHDNQYYLAQPQSIISDYSCTGYRSEMHDELYDIFLKNKDLFQFTHQYKNYLFTHAGVHKSWYKFRFEKDILKYSLDGTLADKLNLAFEHKLDCLFDVGILRGGIYDVGGPFWLDRRNADKPITGFHQYVGHTKVKDFITNEIDNNTSITFCDVLQFKTDCLKLEI